MADGAGSAGRWYRRLLPLSTLLALAVIVLGAYVRLTDAGLGCPDWPGCYGTLTVPDTAAELDRADELYPERPLETGKAWREMIHRYLAGVLGLLVFAIALCAWLNRRAPDQPVTLPLALAALIVAQALLGMWTVTLLLKPVIVMAHLLGGLATLALLFWLTATSRRRAEPVSPAGKAATDSAGLRVVALVGLAALVVQIALGGWTSANYAALACPDFPTCQTQWWPEMDFAEGFTVWRGLGVNYEGGVLDNPARTAIHVTHRIGAVLVTLLLVFLAVRAWRAGFERTAALVLLALAAQLAIGVSLVLWSLPLAPATGHNAGAALLLLAVLNLNHRLRRRRF